MVSAMCASHVALTVVNCLTKFAPPPPHQPIHSEAGERGGGEE